MAGGTLKRWGLVESLQVIWDVPLKGILRPCPLPLSLFIPYLPWDEQLPRPHTPAMMHCLATDLRAREPNDHGLKPLKLFSLNKPFLFMCWIVSGNCYNFRKLTSTIALHCFSATLGFIYFGYLSKTVYGTLFFYVYGCPMIYSTISGSLLISNFYSFNNAIMNKVVCFCHFVPGQV
jgi:hypothetical protein